MATPNNQPATAQQRATVEAAGAKIQAGTTSRYVAIDPNTGEVVGNVGDTLPKTGESFSVTPLSQGGGSGGGGAKKEIPCPFCEGEVLTKRSGRPYQSISAFLQRSFKIRIPTEWLTFIQDLSPVSKSSIRKKPESCKACEGKKVVKDPNNDASRWEAAKAIAEGLAPEIERLENELAPACGNRYTLIQGCDLLEVGLGFNDATAYRVDDIEKNWNIRAGGMIEPGDIEPKKGGPQIPQGEKATNVEGINSLGSPGGHYFIKCANKFSVLAGAQGIELTTGGPLTINAGVTRFTGPEMSIGTQTGRLTLEGETVNLAGKSIEVAPSEGQFFVRGTMGSSGNLMVGGHAHLESASMVKAEMPGRNDNTKSASPNDLYGGPAHWGSAAMESIPATIVDCIGMVTKSVTNFKEIPEVVSLRFANDLKDKVINIAYNLKGLETVPTGICTVLYGSSAGIHPIFNFPHCHAEPNGIHNHEVRVPDMDITAESGGEVRGKQGGVAGGAPVHKQNAKWSAIWDILSIPIGAVWTPIWLAIHSLPGPFINWKR